MIKNLVGRIVKNKRAALAARTLEQFSAFSSKQQLEIIIFYMHPKCKFNSEPVTPVQYYCTSPTNCRMQTRWVNHKMFTTAQI